MAVAKTTQDRIAFLKTLFKPLEEKDLILTFEKHTFEGVRLTAIEAQPVTKFKLAPEKRKQEDGKNKAPVLVKLVFNGENNLVFADEDTTWTAIRNGVRAKVGETIIEVRVK